MLHFWQAGAEVMENVSFGELAAPPGSRRSTTTRSGGYRLLRVFMNDFERISLPLRKNDRWMDNLYNNNNNNNNNNLRGGRPASTSEGATLQRAGHHGQARNTFSSFLPRVPPIPASRPMPSGHFMCMALPPTIDTRREVWMYARACRSKVWRASLGDFGSPDGRSAEPFRSLRAALGDLGGPSGQRGGPRGSTGSNGGARQTLRTVQFGGHVCPRPYELLYILNMQ